MFRLSRRGRYLDIGYADDALLADTREALLKKTVQEALDPRAAEVVLSSIATALDTKRPQRVEYAVETVGRGRRWFEAMVYPLSSRTVQFIARDVTNSLLNSQRLRETLRVAQAASEDKSRFIAAASHDLRQPLQSAFLFLEVLRLHLSDREDCWLADQVHASLTATRELLDELLQIARIESGNIIPRNLRINLWPLIEQICAEAAPMAAEKGLKLRAVKTSARVTGDPVLIKTMLRNLIHNAIKYTERGGVVVGCKRTRGRIEVRIYDTGVGIPRDKFETIFEDFVQLDNPERSRTKGTGLGLAIVRRLAAIMSLEVWVCSRLSRGSVFCIAFPARA